MMYYVECHNAFLRKSCMIVNSQITYLILFSFKTFYSGDTTLSIMTLSIMTLSIMALSIMIVSDTWMLTLSVLKLSVAITSIRLSL
jgi:hypothetical protein